MDREDFILETKAQDGWREEKWQKSKAEKIRSERNGGDKVEVVKVRHRDTREEAIGMETDPETVTGSEKVWRVHLLQLSVYQEFEPQS